MTAMAVQSVLASSLHNAAGKRTDEGEEASANLPYTVAKVEQPK